MNERWLDIEIETVPVGWHRYSAWVRWTTPEGADLYVRRDGGSEAEALRNVIRAVAPFVDVDRVPA